MESSEYKNDKLQVLQIQQENALLKLNDIEKRSELTPVSFLKENYNNIKIKNCKNDPDFKMIIAIALSKISGYMGLNVEVTEFDAKDISKMIQSVFSELTLEELYKAFELERYGEYDIKTSHFNLFNAEYVSTILKKYREWKTNAKVQHNISPPILLVETTESEKNNIVKNGIIRVFNEYKETNEMPEPNNYIFDELMELGLIKKPDTDKLLMYYIKKRGEAEREVMKEINIEKPFADPYQKHTIKEELQKIKDGNSDKVVAKTKTLILNDYFNKLISDGKDISDLL